MNETKTTVIEEHREHNSVILTHLVEMTKLNLNPRMRYRIEQLIGEELIKRLKQCPQFFDAVMDLIKKY